MSDIRIPQLQTTPPDFGNALLTGMQIRGAMTRNALTERQLADYDDDRARAAAAAEIEAGRANEKHAMDMAKAKAEMLKSVLEIKDKETQFAIDGMLKIDRAEYPAFYGNLVKRGAALGIPPDLDVLPHPEQVAAMDDAAWENAKTRLVVDADTRRKIYQKAAERMNTPQSGLGKLMADRDVLPPDDPRRADYDAAIDKETTVDQKALKTWITPDNKIVNLPGNRQPPEGSVPYQPGISLETGPDGQVRFTTTAMPGQAGPGAGFTKKTQGDIETQIVAAREQRVRARNILASFDNRFLKWSGKIQGTLAGLADKAGVNLSEENQQFLTEFTTFSQDAIENINLYIKALTGAQMSEAEAGRLRKAMPDPENDSPIQFKVKLDNVLKKAALAEARFLLLREKGFAVDPAGLEKIEGAYAYDRVETMLRERAQEIGMQIELANPGIAGDDIRRRVRAEMASRYGV